MNQALAKAYDVSPKQEVAVTTTSKDFDNCFTLLEHALILESWGCVHNFGMTDCANVGLIHANSQLAVPDMGESFRDGRNHQHSAPTNGYMYCSVMSE